MHWRRWSVLGRRKDSTGSEPNGTLAHLLLPSTANPELRYAYAALRSSLQLARPTPSGTLLFASGQPGEGKTTVVVNLGLAMMLVGRKVLIIDADVRKPAIHRALELPNTVGLTDIVAGRIHPRDGIQTVKATSERSGGEGTLDVITSGLPDAAVAEALGTQPLREALRYGTSTYDAVLVDSPPVLALNDALLLAPLVDGIVLVVSAGVTSENDAKLVRERLEQVGGRILGVVLNRFNPRLHGPAFHPYSSDYYRQE